MPICFTEIVLGFVRFLCWNFSFYFVLVFWITIILVLWQRRLIILVLVLIFVTKITLSVTFPRNFVKVGFANSLSLRFNRDFPGEPGLARVYWSKGWWRWWWVTSYKSCKAPVKSSSTNKQPTFYRPDVLPVTQLTVSKHWRENITFHGLAYPKLTWGLPTLSLTTNSSWLLWGRVAMPPISPLMPVPRFCKLLLINKRIWQHNLFGCGNKTVISLVSDEKRQQQDHLLISVHKSRLQMLNPMTPLINAGLGSIWTWVGLGGNRTRLGQVLHLNYCRSSHE